MQNPVLLGSVSRSDLLQALGSSRLLVAKLAIPADDVLEFRRLEGDRARICLPLFKEGHRPGSSLSARGGSVWLDERKPASSVPQTAY